MSFGTAFYGRWRLRAKRQVRYTKLGFKLGALGADLGSKARLAVMGSAAMIRQRSSHLASTPVNIELHGQRFSVGLKTRNELDVLLEIGLEDEYGLADVIPAKTIVDLGAHVGLATLRLIAGHPGSSVTCVEADPELIPRLERNVAGHPVRVVHSAIAASGAEQTLYRCDEASWGNSLTKTHPAQKPVQVPGITLEELIAPLGTVDLLKMDIEGAEWDVLDQGIPDQIRAIIGEAHVIDSRRPADFLSALGEQMEIRTVRSGNDRAVFVATR